MQFSNPDLHSTQHLHKMFKNDFMFRKETVSTFIGYWVGVPTQYLFCEKANLVRSLGK